MKGMAMNTFPEIRLRRYRRTAALRRLFDTPLPGPEKFVWPVFVTGGRRVEEPIDAMPGQCRRSVDRLLKAVEPVAAAGVGGILLFGLVEDGEKDGAGGAACRDDAPVQQALRALRQEFPGLVRMADICVCAYTSHGHCGPLRDDGDVENDAANAVLAKMALSCAAAGADIVAPSAMMDGQVAAIRAALDGAGRHDTLIMSYSTKFASAMYGPFREAEKSAPRNGDRRGYQTSWANPRLAWRESMLDEAEGADLLMVKPALFYLDVVARIREQSALPLAVYNVSGEYSMLHAAADRGYGDLRAMVRESVGAMSRAGADLIISYWADRYQELVGEP